MSTAAPQIVRFIASQADGLAFLTGHPLVDRFEQRHSGDDDTEFAALLKPISEEWPWPNDPMAPWPAREADIELCGALPTSEDFLAAGPNVEQVRYIEEHLTPEGIEPFWSAKVWLKTS